ncbi:60S ribosomal protein L27 [Orobanche gracilis]
MVNSLKPNKVAVILQGRHAGKKCVISETYENGTRDHPYGHCVVAGIAKYPIKIIRKDSAKKQAKKSRVKAFIKRVNFTHITSTGYTLDINLNDVVTGIRR